MKQKHFGNQGAQYGGYMRDDLGAFLPSSLISDLMSDKESLLNYNHEDTFAQPQKRKNSKFSYQNEQFMRPALNSYQLFHPKQKYKSQNTLSQSNINWRNYGMMGYPNMGYQYSNNEPMMFVNQMGNTNNFPGNYQNGSFASFNLNNNNFYYGQNNLNGSSPAHSYNTSSPYFSNYIRQNESFKTSSSSVNSGHFSNMDFINMCDMDNQMGLLSMRDKIATRASLSSGDINKKKTLKSTKSKNYMKKPKSKKSLNGNSGLNPTAEVDEMRYFVETLTEPLHSFICSQKGSRVMQKYLHNISPDNLTYLIKKINYNISQLMTDMYGNYFCQKMIQSCSADQRIKLLEYVSLY
jgi:hypothetical protein